MRYNRSRPVILKPYEEIYHEQVGGWLIVLAIVIVVNVLSLTVSFFFKQSFFNSVIWHAMDQADGVSPFLYKILIMAEMIVCSFER